MNSKQVLLILSALILVCGISQKVFADSYDDLHARLLANFPSTFEGKPLHPRTKTLGLAIINQIIEDMRKTGFSEAGANWHHASDYVLYDANVNKKIGNTWWIVYKSADDKVIGTYMMNCDNPANNRLMHTSYKFSGGSYKIKEKIEKETFSHLVCKETRRDIQRF